MALSRVKTWGAEVLSDTDLNAEFNNILNNPISLISPLTANLACGGYALTGVGDVTLNSGKLLTMTAGSAYWAKGADVASAAALSIGADGNYFHVTGTTTITSIASKQAGTLIALRFADALTFTHNATTLILPGAANITTAANDVALMVSEGSGNWRCVNYAKASGVAVVVAATTLSSKAVQATRDTSAVSGTQAITGAGFTPTAAIIFAVKEGAAPTSWCHVDSAGNAYGVHTQDGDAADTFAGVTGVVSLRESAANRNAAVWTSWDADGMTITWTKTGSPTGTAYLSILFLK